MRFIGSKTLLLDHIRAVAEEKAPDARSFCDIFSGTAAVARYFKQWYEVYSNDLLYFSYVLQRATIENDSIPEFDRLKEELGITDPGYGELRAEETFFSEYVRAHRRPHVSK